MEPSFQACSTGCQRSSAVTAEWPSCSMRALTVRSTSRAGSSESAYRYTRGPSRLTITRSPSVERSSPSRSTAASHSASWVPSPSSSKSIVTGQSSAIAVGSLSVSNLLTMRWLAKAFLQKSLSALPQGERANYLLQRHVTHSLPGPEAGFRRRFERAGRHVEAYAEHGPDRPLGEAVFYEFGAGWDLAVPLSCWALGVERQVIVDLRPNVRAELVSTSIERLGRLASERGLRDPGGPIASAEEFEPRFGIRYLAPLDARATGLPAGSVDFVTSTSTLEHIPE